MLDFHSILLISGLALTALSVYLLLSTLLNNKNVDFEALAWASEDEPNKSKSSLINFSRPLVHQLTLQHAYRIKSVKYREKIEKQLLTSGLSKELNVDEFIGLQILWGILFPLLLVILNFALQLGYSYFLCLGVGALGFMFPSLHCSSNKKFRYSSILTDMPFLIDLLALSTEAGLDFVGSIQRIVEKSEDSVLSGEFSIVLKDIKLGSSRSDALRNLSKRVDLPELISFCAVIIDADETGASISQVLKDQSNQMRLERFVRAEKAGAKASQMVLVPMMLFTLPAVFIVVFAPVVIKFFYGGGP